MGFAEDRMMDIITGRAPPPARAESHRSKGSRELARPGPSLLEALGLRRPVANRGHGSLVAVVIRMPEVPLFHSFDQVWLDLEELVKRE